MSKNRQTSFVGNITGSTVHRLKTWPTSFISIASGNKKAEARINDRNYQVGDELLLEEYCPKDYYDPFDPKEDKYTGRILHRKITHILKGEEFGIKKGYVVLSIEKL